ncbi:lysophospholipid acyltransferase family protein [Reichenbachiella agariperforans]|uniref:lysophospholipid acyltransferase family protein n=1 Tax=Reichenbachiella agariperforans TaxID=156994 RepID=UPI001C099558|nr:lysophospholipid acyltransferase family protein [Reichenbachiella agariperforans]MBU2912571.1 1-acyl-sn-glycerol-3-phosphate acyltransferase [Reichenbachiella agariperforans]
MKHFKNTWFWKLILRIYGVYCILLFVATFTLLFPLFVFADKFNRPKFGLILNHYWAHIFFFLIGVRMEITQKTDFDKSTSYILCPNHFSFLDVAILPFVPIPFKFVGKISIAKVPFFGYMFKAFHITVDRSKMRQRYATYQQSIDALAKGFSLAVFPEGGIKSSQPPQMHTFKEGAFRMAVETGAMVVPVTLADNWHMFPTDGKYFFRRRKCRVVIHEPIDPRKYTLDNLKDFQNEVYNLIQTELNTLNNLTPHPVK